MEEIKETQEEKPVFNYTGKVRFYNSDKGFGFIIVGSRADVFFHASQLADRAVIPKRNDKVGFDKIVTDLKGSHAENITIITEDK